MIRWHGATLAAWALLACGGFAESSESAPEPRRDRYVDAVEYLSAAGDQALAQWFELRRQLRANFDDLCGDTFCEGDYPDLQPLDLRCSVRAGDGALHACSWALAGSSGRVTPSTGTLQIQGRVYRCALPATGAIEPFLATLLAAGPAPPLRRNLPGTGRSIYDALAECGVGH